MVRTRASILNTPLPPLPLSSRPRILEAEDIGDSDNCYHEVRTYELSPRESTSRVSSCHFFG